MKTMAGKKLERLNNIVKQKPIPWNILHLTANMLDYKMWCILCFFFSPDVFVFNMIWDDISEFYFTIAEKYFDNVCYLNKWTWQYFNRWTVEKLNEYSSLLLKILWKFSSNCVLISIKCLLISICLFLIK